MKLKTLMDQHERFARREAKRLEREVLNAAKAQRVAERQAAAQVVRDETAERAARFRKRLLADDINYLGQF